FGGTGATSGLVLTPDARLNQIAVVAPADRIKEIVQLIGGMDAPVQLDTKVYRLKNVSPDRVDRLIRDILGAATVKRSYQASVDRESGALVVSATPDVHGRLDALVKELDVTTAAHESPIQFYKLKNTKAVDVLATIAGLFAEQAQTQGENAGTGTISNETGGVGTATMSSGGGMAAPATPLAASQAQPSSTSPPQPPQNLATRLGTGTLGTIGNLGAGTATTGIRSNGS